MENFGKIFSASIQKEAYSGFQSVSSGILHAYKAGEVGNLNAALSALPADGLETWTVHQAGFQPPATGKLGAFSDPVSYLTNPLNGGVQKSSISSSELLNVMKDPQFNPQKGIAGFSNDFSGNNGITNQLFGENGLLSDLVRQTPQARVQFQQQAQLLKKMEVSVKHQADLYKQLQKPQLTMIRT